MQMEPPPEFTALQHEVKELHACWKLYGQLFTTEERLAILDRAATSAFGIFQETLARSIELGIARLLDSTANRKQQNLTLRWLPDLLRARDHVDLANEADTRIAALEALCELVVTRRHKKISHSDLRVSLGRIALDLPTWEQIDQAVLAIGKLMKRVEASLRGESVATVYEYIVLMGDGDELIEQLQMADAHRECERKIRRQTTGSPLQAGRR